MAQPFRFNAAKHTAPEKKVADTANGFRRFGVVDDSLQKLVPCRHSGAQDIQHALVVQLLQQFVGGQHGLRVFFGGAFYPGALLCARIARRNFQRN